MFWKDSRYVTGRLCGKTDRGGLVKANKESYLSIPKIQDAARSFMTVNSLRKNQKERLVVWNGVI